MKMKNFKRLLYNNVHVVNNTNVHLHTIKGKFILCLYHNKTKKREDIKTDTYKGKTMWGQKEDCHAQFKERSLRKTNPAENLISDFWPSQLWENRCLLLKPKKTTKNKTHTRNRYVFSLFLFPKWLSTASLNRITTKRGGLVQMN